MNLLLKLRNDFTKSELKKTYKVGDNVSVQIEGSKGKTKGLISGISRCGNATNITVLFKTLTGIASMKVPIYDPKITITKLSGPMKRMRRAKINYLKKPEKYSVFRKLVI